MTTTETSSQTPRWVWIVVIALVLLALAGLCFSGYALDENHGEGIIIGATIGTALGTLALAGTTYALARATRDTVKEAGAELAELKEQGKVIAEQARIATEQALATARLADASKAGAEAAEKARVDAISPLVFCRAILANIEVSDRTRAIQPYSSTTKWTIAQLEDLLFSVTLKFTLTNVGQSPARVSFSEASQSMSRVILEKLDAVTLPVGKEFSDFYVVTFYGSATTAGEIVKMPFTYEGIMHGEMSDRIQWTGWVTPLMEDSPGFAKQHDRVVNSSGAQVIRSYPNLERPEEMAEVRKALIA